MGGRGLKIALAALAVIETQKAIDRLIDRQAVDPAKRAYDTAHSDAARDLNRLARSTIGTTFTIAAVALILRRVQHGQNVVARRMVQTIGAAQHEARSEALRGLARFVGRVEQRPTVLDGAGHFARVVEAHAVASTEALQHQLARVAGEITAVAQERLYDAAARGEPSDLTLLTLNEELERQFWRVERTARTTIADAYNAARVEGIRALRRQLPDLMSRWTEHVHDATWTPMDNRVGQDSIALHGQVAEPGRVFTMPDDTHVSAKTWGHSWTHPPNRPNDRAVLVPWRRGWGMPAWEWRDGAKHWLEER